MARGSMTSPSSRHNCHATCVPHMTAIGAYSRERCSINCKPCTILARDAQALAYVTYAERSSLAYVRASDTSRSILSTHYLAINATRNLTDRRYRRNSNEIANRRGVEKNCDFPSLSRYISEMIFLFSYQKR